MDEIDKKIVKKLQTDGRKKLNDLAKIIGFTSMGTKKRLERLIEKDVIKVSALLNNNALKLHPAIIMLEMESSEAMQDLLKRFEQCPRIVQIFKTVGGYNLIALVVAETPETLESNIYGKMFPKMQQRHTPLRILPSKRDLLFTVPADKRRISK